MGDHADISGSWLSARESLDAAARDVALAHAAWRGFPDGGTVLDFGGGTGTAARTYSDRPWRTWTVLERNTALGHPLDVAGRSVGWLHTEFPDEASRAAIRSSDLVHASAVLDMLNEQQLRALVAAAVDARVPLYAPLNVLRHELVGGSTEDAARLAAYDAHMSRGAEIGGPLGPAWRHVWQDASSGHSTLAAPSTWRITRDATTALPHIIGFFRRVHAGAGGERWCASVAATLRAGATLLVHHEDVLLLPQGC